MTAGLWICLAAAVFINFQQRIVVELFDHFLAQFQRRQLQEANCLLQLWRHGQLLADF